MLLLVTISIFISQVLTDSNNVCYDEYGCFTILPPFTDRARPLAFLPQSPDIIGTKFFLYTRSNPTSGIEINSFNESRLIKNAKTRFIIHGLLQNGFKLWVNSMKDAILEYENSNVISVDWSKGNGIRYTQSAANSQVVGRSISILVNSYIQKGLIKPDDVHLIGHSLGAHIAGYAGERILNLGRITGLDPAGPYFENTDPIVRLDPSDAQFVDVIHTDGTSLSSLVIGLGMLQSIGHVDFYPNGGKFQPKCQYTTSKVVTTLLNYFSSFVYDQIEDLAVCNHLAAIYFFTNSILNTECPFAAFNCLESEFQSGNCMTCSSSNGCNRMGFHASQNNALGDLYLITQSADNPPYCYFPYQLTLTSANLRTRKQTSGKFSIVLKGSLRNSNSIVIDDNQTTFKEGLVVKRLIDISTNLGKVLSASVSFTQPFCFSITCWFDTDRWSFETIRVLDGSSQEVIELCPKSQDIVSGSSVEFIKC